MYSVSLSFNSNINGRYRRSNLSSLIIIRNSWKDVSSTDRIILKYYRESWLITLCFTYLTLYFELKCMDFIDFKDGEKINIEKFSGCLLILIKVYNSGISIE